MRNRERFLLAAGAAAGLMWWLSRRRRWPGFEGRAVLVTGGSRGLGLALAREFASRGAKVAICARDAGELERAADDLSRRGAEVFTQVCDLTDGAQVTELIAAVERRFGRLDVLVNNAGIIQVGPLDAMMLSDYEDAMNVHFWGPLKATLAALPVMRRQGGGRIVNIASIGGKLSMPHLLPYGASKFALVGLSEGLRAELSRERVWVTTACPGMMRTGSLINARLKGKHRFEYAWFSLSASLPGASIAAERAARRIVEACRRGDPEVLLGPSAQLAARFHGLFPALTAVLLSWINRLLPSYGGIGQESRTGQESESLLTSTLIPRAARRAELEHNERS